VWGIAFLSLMFRTIAVYSVIDSCLIHVMKGEDGPVQLADIAFPFGRGSCSTPINDVGKVQNKSAN